ncbi:MAG: hypothetical protein ACE5PM_06690 [Candidatus Hydrothermarchaeales archaeon]
MISMEALFELVVFATTFLTVVLLAIGISRKRKLTSKRSIERLGMHMTMLKSVFLLGIVALLFSIFHEVLEVMEMYPFFELPFSESLLTVVISMFLLVLCAIILNLKLTLMALEGDG